MSSEEQKQPSMIGAHAKVSVFKVSSRASSLTFWQYVQGAVSDMLGYDGKDTKSEAVQEMRDAKVLTDLIFDL